MVERIRTLLETRQLTPTQFADAIGIARPIVSHILSGRNKPSLEVVQRILAAMPDLSMSWLLNGTGPMRAVAPQAIQPPAQVLGPLVGQSAEEESYSSKKAAVVAPVPEVASATNQRYPTPPTPGPSPPPIVQKAARPIPRRFTSPTTNSVIVPTTAPLAAVASPEAEVGVISAAIKEEVEVIAESGQAVAAPENALVTDEQPQPVSNYAAALFAGTEKPIRRIVIFYRDGSFADYQPE